MTVEQKRRELFEAWWCMSGMEKFKETAWAGFNAALDAVEIELPKRIVDWSTDSWGDGFNVSRDRCKDAIESTGLGIKVKP